MPLPSAAQQGHPYDRGLCVHVRTKHGAWGHPHPGGLQKVGAAPEPIPRPGPQHLFPPMTPSLAPPPPPPLRPSLGDWGGPSLGQPQTLGAGHSVVLRVRVL